MKPKGLAFTLIALGLAIGADPMPGQTMSFFRQFSAPEMNRAVAVAADASGIYVIGNAHYSPESGQSSAGVRKFDSRGNELWTRQLRTPPAEHLLVAAADTTGFYVVGDIPSSFVRKYSASGDELWARQLQFLPLAGLAVDSTGVYVAGVGLLRKYSDEGAELWTSQFGDPNNPPLGVAVDATGAYVLGIERRYDGFTNTVFTSVRKWDPRGNELWTRQLGTPPAEHLLVAAAETTGFYVVGDIRFGSPFVHKYSASGDELWARPVATPSSPLYLKGAAADATGIYFTGTTSLAGPAFPGQCRSGSGSDSVVRKFDSDGAELWTREFGTSDAAWASGVAVDASGVYVVGRHGTAQVEVWFSPPFEPVTFFSTAAPSSGGFLAKFEKSPAVVTGSRPRIFPDCVVNAASYVGGGVAPGEIVTIFGSTMGPSQLVSYGVTDGRLGTTLADTRILFNGVPAPLLYVSDKQSSAIVPYAVADRTSVEVQVEYRGVRSDSVTVPVLRSRPGIFSLDGSGHGLGAILNEDGTVNSPSNPARRGSVITIFGTGGGEAAPDVVDGQIVSGTHPRTSLPVSVFFDVRFYDGDDVPYKPGEVLYAGGSPGSVAGLLQVNVRVPANAVDTGPEVRFALFIGSHWTLFQVTVALR